MPGPMRLGPRGFLTEEEKANQPKVTKELLGRILGYLKPYWLQFLLVFAAILLSAVIGLQPSIITGRIVDEALVGKDLALLIKLLIAAFITMAASQIIGVLERYINSWISQRIIFDMRNQMYDHLQHMPHAFFSTEKQGDIITRMNTDIAGVSTVISGTLTNIVSNAATVITTVPPMSISSPSASTGKTTTIRGLTLPTSPVAAHWNCSWAPTPGNNGKRGMMHITKQLQQLLLVMLVMLPVGRLDKSGKAGVRATA